MNNFGKRAISGFLFVVILTACIYIHPFCFFALFFIINIIGLLEFSHMAEVIHIRVNRTMCILSGSLLFISGFIHNYFGYKEGYLFFFSATFFMGIWELYRKSTHAFQNMAFGIYALFYFTLPFTLLIYLPYLCTGRWQPDIIFFPFQGSFITISVIKKVICFSSVPHSLWGFGNCTGRVPMLFRIWLSGFMLCFISPCPLLC